MDIDVTSMDTEDLCIDTPTHLADECPIVLLEDLDCLTHLSPPPKTSITKWKKKVQDPSIRELVSKKCCTKSCLLAFDLVSITSLRDRYYSMFEADSRAWLCALNESKYNYSYVLCNKVY
jgi:hypothetical protein